MGRISGRVLDQTGAALPGVTYFADEGDFSAAGAANINYVNQLERPIIRVSAGNDGCGRFVGAASRRVGDGYLLVRSS